MTVATHPFHTQLPSHSSLSLHAMQMRCMPVDASSSLSLASSSSSVAGMLSSFFHCCCTHNFTHFADIFHHYIDHYVLIIPSLTWLNLTSLDLNQGKRPFSTGVAADASALLASAREQLGDDDNKMNGGHNNDGNSSFSLPLMHQQAAAGKFFRTSLLPQQQHSL